MTRIKKIQALLSKKKVDALLILKPENVRYLSGFTGSFGKLMIFKKKAVLYTDARYALVARRQLQKEIEVRDIKKDLTHAMRKGLVMGYESHVMTVAALRDWKKRYPDVKFKALKEIVEPLRQIKDANEIKLYRKAGRMTAQCFEFFKKTVKPGQTEEEMEWNLLKIAKSLGAEEFSFPPIIAFGKDTAEVHHQRNTKPYRKGEPLMLDFGLKYKGYCTDMTRMFNEQKLCSILQKAQEAAIQKIKVGASLKSIDDAARTVLKKAKTEDYFTHSLGHGVGFEIHEMPSISQKSKGKIKPGMIFTIEPGIYIEGKGGARLEDMVLVDLNGRVSVITRQVL